MGPRPFDRTLTGASIATGRIIPGMIVATSHRSARLLGRARFGLLALVAVWLAHDAVFVVEHGIGAGLARAMRDGGHDAYWPAFSIVAIVAATVLGLRAVVRLGRLRDTARPGRGTRSIGGRSDDAAPSYGRQLVRLWLPLYALVAVAFAIQENVEHLAGHGHLIGAGALVGPEYPLAIPVIGLVSLVAAAIGSLVRWRIAVLEARLGRRAEAPRDRGLSARRPAPRWALVAAERLHALWLVRLDAGRAPPLVA